MRISDWSSDVCSSDLFVDRPRAVGHALAAFQHCTDRRMSLPALEFLERRQIRIRVVESDDKAQGHLPVRLVIKETTAPGIAQRPALGMEDRKSTRLNSSP